MAKTSVELIVKAQEGDKEAFETLFQTLYKNVYYTAYCVCKNDDEAKEATQLAFIQLHKSIKKLQDPRTFDVWLHRIVVNKCYNLFSKRKDKIIDPTTSEIMRNEKEKRLYMLPIENTRFESDQEVLYRLINELPEKYRILLNLMYFHQHTLIEIEEITGLAKGTIKSRLFAARNLLKKKIEVYENINECKLDFHSVSFEALLISAFAFGIEQLQFTIPASIVASLGISGGWFTHVLGTGGVKAVAIVAVSAITTTSIYATYQAIQSKLQQVDPPIPTVLAKDAKYPMQQDEKPFHIVTIDQVDYETPQDAYYSLLKWAHCDVELNSLSRDEILHFAPLYNALKESNGSYYQELQDKGWGTTYENLLK